jgi:hypothetical protein
VYDGSVKPCLVFFSLACTCCLLGLGVASVRADTTTVPGVDSSGTYQYTTTVTSPSPSPSCVTGTDLTGLCNSDGTVTTSTTTPTPPTSTSGLTPDSSGNCHFVLVTVNVGTGGSCDSVDFTTYLNTFLNQIIPYILLIAMIMIVFSGFQYMTSGLTGDTKAARSRIIGIITGVIFFFLIRLILNQVAPGITLNSTTTPASSTTNTTGNTATSTS